MNGPMWSYRATVALSPDVFRGASRFNVIVVAPLSHGGDRSEQRQRGRKLSTIVSS